MKTCNSFHDLSPAPVVRGMEMTERHGNVDSTGANTERSENSLHDGHFTKPQPRGHSQCEACNGSGKDPSSDEQCGRCDGSSWEPLEN